MEGIKEIKFPNGSVIVFFSPKSGIDPRKAITASQLWKNAYLFPVLDIDEVDARMVEINKG